MKTLYMLKQTEAAFQVTAEGPFEYHTFRHGEAYKEVPPEEMHKFDKMAMSDESLEGGKS